MITDWLIRQLEPRSNHSRLIVSDPLDLAPKNDPRLRAFADKHGFIIVAASTNLVFRELLAAAKDDSVRTKFLLFDKTPYRRRTFGRRDQAPPLFYPDLLEGTASGDCVDLSLAAYLVETTGDRGWPRVVDTPEYARAIIAHHDDIIAAHRNLRQVDPVRFTDGDLKTIVTMAALGMGASAFGSVDPAQSWRIGLLHHTEFTELGRLAPEILATIRSKLSMAPRPFAWFADHDPETVIRGFYLGLILGQHDPNWELLLSRIDPELRFFSGISANDLQKYAPEIIKAAPERAERDCAVAEEAMDAEVLQEIAYGRLRLGTRDGFFTLLEREQYSTLLRSLALLEALRDLLGPSPDLGRHAGLAARLHSLDPTAFIERREGTSWLALVQAYMISEELVRLGGVLVTAQKDLQVAPVMKLGFKDFWKIWVDEGLSRIEYALSAAERSIYLKEDRLLPRTMNCLPREARTALDACRDAIDERRTTVTTGLEEVNRAFQKVVSRQFRAWRKGESDPVLTSQFIDRVLVPNWDPEKEKAVILVLDGIRYDVWTAFARPLFLATMQPVTSVCGCAQLPSETHVSRKAIAAGAEPNTFSSKDAENLLLTQALTRIRHTPIKVEKVEGDGLAVGETVRFRSSDDQLSMVIFSYFDNELHHISLKEKNGVTRPEKPLKDLYDQFKRFIEEDVMDVVRSLPEGTKVFVVADHGAGPVGTKKIFFQSGDLGDDTDCSYLHCALRTRLDLIDLPPWAREQIIGFSPDEIGMPKELTEVGNGRSQTVVKRQFASYVFPAPGYAFSRPNSQFRPPAWSHGGCSFQELLVPMEVFIVRPASRDLVQATFDSVPTNSHEGEEIEVVVRFERPGAGTLEGGEVRVSLEAYTDDTQLRSAPPFISVRPWELKMVTLRFTPDLTNVSPDERRASKTALRFAIRYVYQDGECTVRRTLTREIRIQLNPDRVVRRVGSLGSILGLSPKGPADKMRLE